MAKGAFERKTAPGRSSRRVSATELARRLPDVLNRVHYQRETIIVERGGKPLCQIAPVPSSPDFKLSDLVTLLAALPSSGEK
jgi:antitoxin (DNA-binding transcriptional repressor) of toxin-antitoxin stability system